jgi:hypothetical protein
MKTIFTLVLSTLLVISFAQSSEKIDLNGLECTLNANGSLFQSDGNWGLLKVGGPTGNGLMYTGHLWLAAKRDDTLLAATQTYYLAGNPSYPSTDFRYGPKANTYNTAFTNRYNRVWKMHRSMIEHHINHYQDSGYQAFPEILHWPAHGDTTNGEAWLLAPFADLNGNHIYEPLSGEFPEIKGDQSLYCIFNDDARYNPESSLTPLGIEVHLELYAFNAAINAHTGNAIFLNYRIVNRSNKTLDTVYASQWYDSDLGNAFDDICGTDSVRKLSYTYNADSLDEGANGFGLNPPAVGFAVLQGEASGGMYYNNSGGFSGPAATTDPFLLNEWYHLLRNHWKDAMPLRAESPSGPFSIFNGDGYDPTGFATKSNWAFNDQANWYCSPLNNGDKRQLLNFNPQALAPSDTLCLDLVLHFSRDLNDANPIAAVDKLKIQNDSLVDFWNQLNYTCSSNLLGQSQTYESLPFELYPNPSHGSIFINWKEEQAHFTIYNLRGEHLLDGKLYGGQNQLNIRALAPGVYLFLIQDSEGGKAVRKFMKR